MKIVITGASRGIGLATAKKLNTTQNELFLSASTTASFQNDFTNAKIYGADLSKTPGISELANSIKNDTQQIDVLVNNAGVMLSKRFENTSIEEIENVLSVDLKSHILLTKELLPLLLKSPNPTIVFVSSMAAHSQIIGESVYSAAKAGITNFAKTLRNEFEGKLRVSIIHAWGVNTYRSEQADQLEANKLLLNPDKVGEAIEFVVTRSPEFVVESLELGVIGQWHGGNAPWSPQS